MELTREQFTESLENFLLEKDGFLNLTKLVAEIIMGAERELFKEEHSDVSNGYRPRRLITNGGIVELQVPRTRRHNFMPVILGIIKSQNKEMANIASHLYRCGNTLEDISGVFEILYGKTYSTSQINRLTLSSKKAVEEWRSRQLLRHYEAIMIDATYLSVRRGESVSKEAFFCVMGLKEDGSREMLGVYNNPTEGSGIWRDFFQDLKTRGVETVGLIISDGLNGIENVAQEYFPDVEVQLCTVHLKREIEKKLRPKDKAEILGKIKEVFDPHNPLLTYQDAIEAFKKFAEEKQKTYPFLGKIANGSRIRFYFTFLKYEITVRKYIHSTNWIERFNRNVKKGAYYKCSFPSVESALYLVGGIASNATYLKRKIADLRRGLHKISE